MSQSVEAHRAKDYDQIRPLIELCKAGKLFEVQEWIAAGNPVNPPPLPTKGQRGKTPLEVAIEHGFHSLIKILLQAGAVQEPDDYRSPMNSALSMRRMDIVTLLVEHGYDPRSVDMRRVFDTWDPGIMEYFIERGAEAEEGNPFAYAFCSRIKTAFRVYKQYRDRFPTLREQANTALRHHCKDGNLKWVSLMLWAGADPYAPGPQDWDDEPDPEYGGSSALELAARYNHFEIFGIRQLRLDPKHPGMKETIYSLCDDEGFPILKKLLAGGMDPNDGQTGGCSVIQSLLHSMDWDFSRFSWDRDRSTGLLDTENAREKLKAIHLLAKHGAKWIPKEKRDINSARRSLLKLKPDYTVEFVWLMSKFKACSREQVQALIGSPTMKRHIAQHGQRLHELLSSWKENESVVPAQT
jgi:hypothetical protein